MILDRCVTQGLQANTLFVQRSLRHFFNRHEYRKVILKAWLSEPEIPIEKKFSELERNLPAMYNAVVKDLQDLLYLRARCNNEQDCLPLKRRAIMNTMIDRLTEDLDAFLDYCDRLRSKEHDVNALTEAFARRSLNNETSPVATDWMQMER